MRNAAVIVALVLFTLAPTSAQRFNEETAGDLRSFERDWLTAYLNDDRPWLSRFASGKLNVLPLPGTAFDERRDAVSQLKETDLRANEMKVRISGTISLLTNDPKRNRAFYFLDTFNRIGGKWQVIASSISPTPPPPATQIKNVLLKFENELAQAIVGSDVPTFEALIAPEFIATSRDGRLLDRDQWVGERRAQRVRSAELRDVKVNISGDDVAVVTGVTDSVELNESGNAVARAERFTHTWSQRAGKWQCVAAHMTLID